MKYIALLSKWKYAFAVLLVTSFTAFAQTVSVAGADTAFKHANDSNLIYYNSDTVKLKGYLYKPEGKGTFPVYMWNDKGGKDPNDYLYIAHFWTDHGFIFFMPLRRGCSDNPGTYIGDEEKQIRRKKEMEQVQFKQIYALHKKANEDVIAALKWIRKQPHVDTNNIVVSGEGYGGMQVLLTAAKDGQSPLGVKSFVASFTTVSDRWNILWGDSLKQAINRAKKPIFLLQEKSEHSPSPIDSLGIALTKKEFPNRYKLYPDYNGSSIDPKVWEKDEMQYLKDCEVRRMK